MKGYLSSGLAGDGGEVHADNQSVSYPFADHTGAKPEGQRARVSYTGVGRAYLMANGKQDHF